MKQEAKRREPLEALALAMGSDHFSNFSENYTLLIKRIVGMRIAVQHIFAHAGDRCSGRFRQTRFLSNPCSLKTHWGGVGDMPESRKVFVKTYGCQMNAYDSTRMAELLAPLGYAATEEIADADVIILNTCHIRDKAAEKVYSELGRVRDIKHARQLAGKNTLVAVSGCVAQAEGGEIVRRAAVVDLVVGPQSYHRLPELIVRVKSEARPLIETNFPAEDKFAELPQRAATRAASAFLTVQEGCDRFCTFCVVPYTRGAEFSRPVDQIESEARQLVSTGVREITLLGQNVNSYHGEGEGGIWSLARLIHHLAKIEGLERLRYTTSHPRYMREDLIAAHADEPKLMPYLHLPFQSGADRILAAMNRKHTATDYLRLIDQIRSARGDIALSTDIIVGFPGESEHEFAATLEIVRQVGFAQAYSFKYSARPGTPAATMEEQIPEPVKTDRLLRLQQLLGQQQTSFNASCVGKVLPVLFDKIGRRTGQLVGRSPYLQAVHIEAESALLGRIMAVEISSAGPNSLSGIIKAT
jgi:tRNA-2-methylthio-N6-dimethylallyladenosine synthase